MSDVEVTGWLGRESRDDLTFDSVGKSEIESSVGLGSGVGARCRGSFGFGGGEETGYGVDGDGKGIDEGEPVHGVS